MKITVGGTFGIKCVVVADREFYYIELENYPRRRIYIWVSPELIHDGSVTFPAIARLELSIEDVLLLPSPGKTHVTHYITVPYGCYLKEVKPDPISQISFTHIWVLRGEGYSNGLLATFPYKPVEIIWSGGKATVYPDGKTEEIIELPGRFKRINI